MRRAGLLLAAALAGVVPVAAASPATGARGPTARLCLRAWNAPANGAARHRLRRLGAKTASLRPGVAGTDTVSAGGAATTTSAPACQLRFARRRKVYLVVGAWERGRVTTWTFWRPALAHGTSIGANLHVLADGSLARL